MTILALLFISTASIGRTLWPLFGYQAIDTGVVVVNVHMVSYGTYPTCHYLDFSRVLVKSDTHR